MKRTALAGGLSLILFALAGIAWFALEAVPVGLGFEDTDDPAVSVAFLRDHAVVWAQAGLALFGMAAGLLVASLAVADLLALRAGGLALRAVTVVGVLSATFLFGQGVLRNSALPILHIDGLSAASGEAAYLAVQMAGVHGFAQGGILAFSAWAVGISVIGLRSRSIPVWLGVLGVIPAFRIVASLLGPHGVSTDALWVVYMASIIGTLLWCLAFGAVLMFGALRRARTLTE